MQIREIEVARPTFQYSIENLRGLAIVFVVFSHISTYGRLGLLGDCLYFFFRDATVWFIFISGYLFNHLESARFDYKSYFSKKVKYVLLPYLILSIPAIMAGLFFQAHRVLGLEAHKYVLWSLVVGGSVIVPMWFIPMIMIFFLFSPAFYWLGLCRAQYLITLFGIGVSLLTSRPVENMNPLLAFVHFAGFYLLGIVVSKHYATISKFARTTAAMNLIAVAIIAFACSSLAALRQHDNDPAGFLDGMCLFNNLVFGKLCLLVIIFLLFERYMNVRNRVLGWMAEISFGIFFLHGFFMIFFRMKITSLLQASPVFAVALEIIFILCSSIVAVLVLRKILGRRSRYVIGC